MSFEIELVVAGASGISALINILKSIFRSPLKTTIINPPGSLKLDAEVADVQVSACESFENFEETIVRQKDGRLATEEHEVVSFSKRRVEGVEAARPKRSATVSAHFKLVFLAVLFLTIASITAAGVISFWPDPLNPNQQKVFDTLVTAFTAGLGAILGLIGGKTIR